MTEAQPLAGRHIVHLTTVHPVQDSRILHKQCRSVAAAGARVTLVAVAPEHGDLGHGVALHALPAPGGRVARMTVTATRAIRAARQLRADLYHFHDPELIGVGVALKAMGHRVVYDVHEDVPLDLLTKGYLPAPLRPVLSTAAKLVHRGAERALDGVVVVTPSVGRPFRAPTMVRNYPILTEFGTVGPPLHQRPPHAVYIGGISRIRGFDQMCQAAELLDGRDGFALQLAGIVNPPELLHELPDGGPVSYVGQLDRAGVQALLNRVRVGLVTLPGDNVGFQTAYPIKLFEYMAAAIPVVASDFPVYREIVDGAGCGLCVDPADPHAIAKAVTWLLDNPDDAAAMGRRGRQAVENTYNWEVEQRGLIALYETILEDRPRRAGAAAGTERRGAELHQPAAR